MPHSGWSRQRLGVTKVEARQRLRAAVSDGLVIEAVEQSVAEPGRRVFSLRHPEGVEELERLQAQGARELSPSRDVMDSDAARRWDWAGRSRAFRLFTIIALALALGTIVGS